MRKVDKTKLRTPQLLLSPDCINKINDAISNIGTHVYSTSYYASRPVHSQLYKLYKGKCAFCESDVRAGSAIQIDHYRPKKGVKEDSGHSGYYWLGYEWTNLISLCSKCNRSKSHHFPIESIGLRQYIHPPSQSNYLINSIELTGEKPMLINPETHDPQKYFTFLPSGKIKGKGQPEADKTIEICKLNRKDLQLARKKLRDDLLKGITRTLTHLNNGEIDIDTFKYHVRSKLEDLLEIYINNGAYSAYCLAIIKHFPYFIESRFNARDKRIIGNVYTEFITYCKSQLP